MGNIAMLPQDELIPVIDWTDPDEERVVRVEGYLVASQSLDGLSGSPVFVRPEIDLSFAKLMQGPEVAEKNICGPYTQIELLGLWQGSWTAPPDEFMAADHKFASGGVTVPVGTGIIVSFGKIIELLEMDEVKRARQRFYQSRAIAASRVAS